MNLGPLLRITVIGATAPKTEDVTVFVDNGQGVPIWSVSYTLLDIQEHVPSIPGNKGKSLL